MVWLFRQEKGVHAQGKRGGTPQGPLPLSTQKLMTCNGRGKHQMLLTALQQTRVGSVGAWAEEVTPATGRNSAVCPTWALSLLVLIDLSLSRGTHSEPVSEARKSGIGLAPQQPCRQKTMKVETGKKEARLMFFRSQWSLVMGCRGKGQRRVRRVQGEGPACPTTALGLRTGGEPGMVCY